MEEFIIGSEIRRGLEGIAPWFRGENSVESALDRLGLNRKSLLFGNLTLSGETAFLPVGETWPAECRLKLSTMDVDAYKKWIGFPDPASPGMTRDLPAEPDLELLAKEYLFGDSRGLGEFKGLIEERFAPFEAMLVTAGRIELRNGSKLIIRGFPTILVAEELILEQGSSLVVNIQSHLTIGRLVKTGGARGGDLQ